MLVRSFLVLLLSLWIPFAVASGDDEDYVGYVELKPFVANFGESTQLHFVKCEITIQSGSEATQLALEDHIYAIRNDILFLLMAQSEESMSSVAAQKILAKKAILLVKQRLLEEEGEEMVTDLFFVSFVAQ